MPADDRRVRDVECARRGDYSGLPLMISTETAGAILNISPYTVRSLIEKGELKGYKIASFYRLDRDEVLAMIGKAV